MTIKTEPAITPRTTLMTTSMTTPVPMATHSTDGNTCYNIRYNNFDDNATYENNCCDTQCNPHSQYVDFGTMIKEDFD